ncbi:MAG: hypothetical protein OXF54_08640 [Caldilineaceae bacterium]|nr:hypothetical protein [Caldilineaceae bacterium]
MPAKIEREGVISVFDFYGWPQSLDHEMGRIRYTQMIENYRPTSLRPPDRRTASTSLDVLPPYTPISLSQVMTFTSRSLATVGKTGRGTMLQPPSTTASM